MWVHLTTIIAISDVDLRLVDKTNDLNVIRGFQELDTGYSISGEEASPVPWLAAPCNHLALGVGYSRIRF
jgi:hypothetical protein